MPPTLIKLPHADVPGMAKIKKFTVKRIIYAMGVLVFIWQIL